MAKQETASEFQTLKTDIREKRTQRLYIFHGQEQFLLRYYLQQIKKLLIDDLTESFNYHRFTGETFDMEEFADAEENLPMMAQSTMVQVDDVDFFKFTESDREKVQQIISDIPEYCSVVFTYGIGAWKPDKRFKKLWDTVSANAQIVEFEKQSQRDLIAWITRHFAAANKNISTDLCAYLIGITDGTMTSLSGEIAKICAYSGADVIKKSDIDAVTEPVLDAVVFQMTDLMSQKRHTETLNKLNQLLKMQQEPLSILGAVGGHFRRLATARAFLDNGANGAELQKLYGIGDYAARKTMDAARRFSPAFLQKAANLVLETDYRMKTSFDEQERLLEMLILQLAQEAQNG